MTSNPQRYGPPVGRVVGIGHQVEFMRTGNGGPVLPAKLRQEDTGGTSGRSVGLVLDLAQHHTAGHRHGI